MKIRNRRQLFDDLEDVMTKTYEKIKEEGELEYEQNILKTYIIESNIGITDIQNFYSQKFNLSLEKTEDETLYVLSATKDDKRAEFYVDTFNKRFWVLHTVSKSLITDKFIKWLVSPIMSHLDHPWLDKKFLESIKGKNAGYMRGIGIQYKHSELFPEEENGMEYFTMRAWGSLSNTILKEMEKNESLERAMALTSIGIKKKFENNEIIETLIEDINYQSKFSVKGTSIQAHLEMVEDIQKTYYDKLKIIEEESSLTYERKKHSIEIQGAPLLISIRREIEDLKKFLDIIFSSKAPFRVAGFVNFIEKNAAVVAGMDLHNGDKFEMEITPAWIRFYLPKGACGNTIIRFVSNLQRYYDSNITLEGTENGKII